MISKRVISLDIYHEAIIYLFGLTAKTKEIITRMKLCLTAPADAQNTFCSSDWCTPPAGGILPPWLKKTRVSSPRFFLALLPPCENLGQSKHVWKGHTRTLVEVLELKHWQKHAGRVAHAQLTTWHWIIRFLRRHGNKNKNTLRFAFLAKITQFFWGFFCKGSL